MYVNVVKDTGVVMHVHNYCWSSSTTQICLVCKTCSHGGTATSISTVAICIMYTCTVVMHLSCQLSLVIRMFCVYNVSRLKTPCTCSRGLSPV